MAKKFVDGVEVAGTTFKDFASAYRLIGFNDRVLGKQSWMPTSVDTGTFQSLSGTQEDQLCVKSPGFRISPMFNHNVHATGTYYQRRAFREPKRKQSISNL